MNYQIFKKFGKNMLVGTYFLNFSCIFLNPNSFGYLDGLYKKVFDECIESVFNFPEFIQIGSAHFHIKKSAGAFRVWTKSRGKDQND